MLFDKNLGQKIKLYFNPGSPYAFGLVVFHIFGLIGLYNIFRGQVLLSTIIFMLVQSELACLGVTIGAHRLFSHRSFKATTPLKILVVACQSLSGQNTVWQWVRMHRVHHKYVDTDPDPHDSTKGFYHSHIGWAMTYDENIFRPHGKKVDMSDIIKEPVVMWQKKHLGFFGFFFVLVVLPTWISMLCFGESLFNSFCVAASFKAIYVSHRTFLINSVAHMWGSKPYDKSMCPTENKFVSFACCGEGWHNYHHSFPHDYKTSELGLYRWNLAAAVIDFFAWIGWAYDLKTASKEAVLSRVGRTGDKRLYASRTFG